jgi:hypothetical protein
MITTIISKKQLLIYYDIDITDNIKRYISKFDKYILYFYTIGLYIFPIILISDFIILIFILVNDISIISHIDIVLIYNNLFIFIILIIFSYLFHELGHLLVIVSDDDVYANSFGIILLLNVYFVGMYIEQVDNGYISIKSLTAGILNNIILVIIFSIIYVFINNPILLLVIYFNILLIVVNTYPLISTDGGRYINFYINKYNKNYINLLIAIFNTIIGLLLFNTYIIISILLLYISYKYLLLYIKNN